MSSIKGKRIMDREAQDTLLRRWQRTLPRRSLGSGGARMCPWSMATVVQSMKLVSHRVFGLDDFVLCVGALPSMLGLARLLTVWEKWDLQCWGALSPPRRLVETIWLLVGWSSARLKVLEKGPLRCFGCIGVGHTRPTCLTVDQMRLCVRDTLPAHEAGHSTSGQPSGRHGCMCQRSRTAPGLGLVGSPCTFCVSEATHSRYLQVVGPVNKCISQR